MKAGVPRSMHYTCKAKSLSTRLIRAVHGTPGKDPQGEEHRNRLQNPLRSSDGCVVQPATGRTPGLLLHETKRRGSGLKQTISRQI